MKCFAILLSLAAPVLLAGCALKPQHGRTTSDPLALAHRFQASGTGFDYQAFCKELHIKCEMFGRADGDPPIAVEVFALDTVSTNLWKMIVVRNGWNTEWQYLLFAPDGQDWRLIGRIDVPAQPYVEPNRRIERGSGGKAWLVLTYVTAWGTGVYDRKQAWYSLGRRAVKLERQATLANEGWNGLSNNWVQATPDYACLLFLSQGSGAPDPAR